MPRRKSCSNPSRPWSAISRRGNWSSTRERCSKGIAPCRWMKSADANVPGGDDQGKSNQWLAFLNLGWLIMLYMLVFAGGGLWLDRRFRTAPWLMLVGVLLGFTGSGY